MQLKRQKKEPDKNKKCVVQSTKRQWSEENRERHFFLYIPVAVDIYFLSPTQSAEIAAQ